MDVLGGDPPAGAHVQLDDQVLPGGFLRPEADHRPLAGYWVLEYVSCLAHICSFLMFDRRISVGGTPRATEWLRCRPRRTVRKPRTRPVPSAPRSREWSRTRPA